MGCFLGSSGMMILKSNNVRVQFHPILESLHWANKLCDFNFPFHNFSCCKVISDPTRLLFSPILFVSVWRIWKSVKMFFPRVKSPNHCNIPWMSGIMKELKMPSNSNHSKIRGRRKDIQNNHVLGHGTVVAYFRHVDLDWIPESHLVPTSNR